MGKVYFEGKNDALLCVCGNEMRVAETLEINDDLHVFEMGVYRPKSTNVSTEQIDSMILVTKRIGAEAVAMMAKSLRATATCGMCRTPNTYQLSFDGHKIVDLSVVS